MVGNCQTGSAVSLKRVLGLGLIDTKDPSQSLLLLKPLDQPGSGITHGGGRKLSTSDPTYLSFKRFVEHYQQCQQP
jgi:hypothetical protein